MKGTVEAPGREEKYDPACSRLGQGWASWVARVSTTGCQWLGGMGLEWPAWTHNSDST